ncbi:hypothetical protein A6A04_08455 [Paramagnetospirillum marisnigri]|uniref:Response regulatory domain-containing protein n=1 Tax=Paramagnetospirillum marisnigri TaxID=1285242 RepID=A0A178M7W3_9PROT|nr:response regulator [Paramagnetospirillum marisnigri]OAN44832.1 hypothetical protein A6A04_08455 [Paramagnetospirillum marisnigri]
MDITHKVLLVEDQIADATLIKIALAEAAPATEIDHVVDGVAALEYLNANPRPDLVMMDINMPRMNGLECIRRLRADERFVTLPVVMLTTSKAEKDIKASYAAGANSYVTKPVGLDEMIAALKVADEWWFHTVLLDRGDPVQD